jgi:hypothetical protein
VPAALAHDLVDGSGVKQLAKRALEHAGRR